MDTGGILTTIGGIVIAVIIIVGLPLMTMSGRADDIAQSSVQAATVDFAEDIRTTGLLTMSKYSKFVENISATGNAYDVQMEIRTLDENPGKKTSQATSTKIGENVYYSTYTSQIIDLLGKGNIALKEGDYFIVSVTNTSPTLATQLQNAFYRVSGSDIDVIKSEDSVMVTANGTRK